MTVSDEKLPKEESLIKTGEFRKIYKSGGSFSNGQFVLRILPNSLGLNRIGFSISSAVIKKATRRNRARRLFREVFRKNKAALKKGFDIALIIRKAPAARFSHKEAEAVFLSLTKRAKITV